MQNTNIFGVKIENFLIFLNGLVKSTLGNKFCGGFNELAELRAAKTPSMTIISTKGTLDWAYPPFILASTASALGWDVSVFFTFYGLNLLKKDLGDLKVSPLGNPGVDPVNLLKQVRDTGPVRNLLVRLDCLSARRIPESRAGRQRNQPRPRP